MVPLAELKAKADLVSLITDRMPLKRRGRDWWGCCPFHEDGTPSFKVDPERQEYQCFGCRAHGDAIDFVMTIDRVDLKAAVEKLKELVGRAPDHRSRRPAPRARPGRDNGALAREIWRQTERIRDRLALDYLVCRRRLTTWDDDRIRWHPECPWHDQRVGCIVCPVVSHQTGYVVGIWRIRPTLEGKVERMGLGPAKGNVAPLWWPDGDELAIAEGVEDALAVHALTGMPCWAALSSGNMAELRGIPSWVEHVSIFTDADTSGRLGAHRLAARLREEGHRAQVLRAVNVKDPNDVLLARAG